MVPATQVAGSAPPPNEKADDLLTAVNGVLGDVCSDQVRDRIAIFASGQCMMVANADNHPEVMSVLGLAKRLGYPMRRPQIVDHGTLKGVYHASGSAAANMVPLRTSETKRAESTDGHQQLKADAYQLLQRAVAMRGVSDVIVKCESEYARVYALVDGFQLPLIKNDWSPQYGQRFLRAIYAWAGVEGVAERGWKQGAHQVGQISKGLPAGLDSVRLQMLASAFDGKELIMRLMPRPANGRVLLPALGFDEAQIAQFSGIIAMSDGVVIVTGPTGTGKTTTLHGLLSHSLDLFEGDRWITVEDPVEIRLRHPNVTQVDVVKNADNEDTDQAYNDALIATLRSAPRRLLFGEIRSNASAQIAMRAALTGHAVLTTLHTEGALGAVARLLDMGISPALLQDQNVIRGISSQRLLRKLCSCAIDITRDQWAGFCPSWLDSIFVERGKVRVPNPHPCGHCRAGYEIGRKVITEIMQPDEEMLSLLIGGFRQKAKTHWKSLGGRPMGEQAIVGVFDGRFDPKEVMRCINL
ncbi:ATPase, T2SS/T4P/T4SS family [Telmatospirillum siberiense]|uniref:Bacterial type II secretion system protein E domain-containing protein n=1 Tax=Telmatospirillum siberiense TaxID=382514 RepID=A0A2N3PLX0_9PROT|nr:ATPase, T2SS/T4P/T4SS family [Telmatospirillum siberiense]PKU21395.1 hypothetical protein CWS72_26990 [Telmatospirillum siberiense]